jgi:hypothetical protein
VTNFGDATLSVLVHADAKIGKTTLACSGPPPILSIDAEGSTKFIKLRKVQWDPHMGAPPLWDGSWDMCVVKIRNWQTVKLIYQHLTQSPHNFRTITVDSITEIQRQCKTNLKGSEALQIQDWGKLLSEMDTMIRSFRDLTLMDNTIQVVVFVAETRLNQKGKYVPYMQGQIGISLPYWVDVCGYLFTERAADANGQATGPMIRKLWVTPHPMFEAGERCGGALGDVVDEPTIQGMLTTVFGEQATAPSQVPAVQ